MKSGKAMDDWYTNDALSGESFDDFCDRVGYAQCSMTGDWGEYGREVGYLPGYEYNLVQYDGLGELIHLAHVVRGNEDVVISMPSDRVSGTLYRVIVVGSHQTIVRHFSDTDTYSAYERAYKWIASTKLIG